MNFPAFYEHNRDRPSLYLPTSRCSWWNHGIYFAISDLLCWLIWTNRLSRNGRHSFKYSCIFLFMSMLTRGHAIITDLPNWRFISRLWIHLCSLFPRFFRNVKTKLKKKRYVPTLSVRNISSRTVRWLLWLVKRALRPTVHLNHPPPLPISTSAPIKTA